MELSMISLFGNDFKLLWHVNFQSNFKYFTGIFFLPEHLLFSDPSVYKCNMYGFRTRVKIPGRRLDWNWLIRAQYLILLPYGWAAVKFHLWQQRGVSFPQPTTDKSHYTCSAVTQSHNINNSQWKKTGIFSPKNTKKIVLLLHLLSTGGPRCDSPWMFIYFPDCCMCK